MLWSPLTSTRTRRTTRLGDHIDVHRRPDASRCWIGDERSWREQQAGWPASTGTAAGEHKFVEQRLQDSNRGFELGAIGILHFLSVEDGR